MLNTVITIITTLAVTTVFIRGCGYGLVKSKTPAAENLVRLRAKKGATLHIIKSIPPIKPKKR